MTSRVTVNDDRVIRNLSGIERDIRRLGPQLVIGQLAEAMIGTSKIRAPFMFGELQNSDFATTPVLTGGVFRMRIGFNARHAAVQDTGFKVRVIRPIRAKKLFVPISKRAARQGPTKGNLRKKQLRVGIDVLFLDEVKTPRTKKGRKSGPNLYFTGMIRDYTRKRSPALATLFIARGLESILNLHVVKKVESKVRKATGLDQFIKQVESINA